VKPLAIDLFCGLGGWTEGLLAEGWYVVGFDIERHEYWVPEAVPDGDGSKGTRPVAKRGITQGCAVSLGMEGANAKPRTKMLRYPAQLVLQDVLTLHGSQFKDAALIVASPPCQGYSYRAMPWSRAKALPPPDNSLFEACFRIQREACDAAGRHIPLVVENVRGAQKWVGRARWNFGSFYLWGDVPALMPKPASSLSGIAKNQPVGRKTLGHVNQRDGYGHTRHLTNQAESDGVKQHKSGRAWFADPDSISGSTSSKSNARKAASAMIAKIPFVLSQYIAATFKPNEAVG
jgi:hypothetical protein